MKIPRIGEDGREAGEVEAAPADVKGGAVVLRRAAHGRMPQARRDDVNALRTQYLLGEDDEDLPIVMRMALRLRRLRSRAHRQPKVLGGRREPFKVPAVLAVQFLDEVGVGKNLE